MKRSFTRPRLPNRISSWQWAIHELRQQTALPLVPADIPMAEPQTFQNLSLDEALVASIAVANYRRNKEM